MKNLIIFVLIFLATISYSQDNQVKTPPKPNKKSDFWEKVRFGGGLNLSFGNTTVIGVSPEAIYQINDKFSIGAGVGYQYVKYDYHQQNIFTLSTLGLYNPVNAVQLSVKLEQNFLTGDNARNVAALYVGAGYSPSPNITMGVQYDVLYDKNKSLYTSPFAPFMRVYF